MLVRWLKDLRTSARRRRIDDLKSTVPIEYHALLDAAFAGDIKAAKAISFTLPANLIAAIAVGSFKAKMPASSFRELLHYAWSTQYGHLMDAANGDARIIRRLFVAAQFDCSHLPERLTIYRGYKWKRSMGKRPHLSWTTDRDTACWFAITHSIDPVVFKAEASRDEIIYFSNDRNENEVVLKSDRPLVIDGDKNEWLDATCRHGEAIIAHNEKIRGSDRH